METDIFSLLFFFFLPKQLWSLPTLPPTKWLQLYGKERSLSVLKDEIQKEYNKLKHLKISIIGTSHV